MTSESLTNDQTIHADDTHEGFVNTFSMASSYNFNNINNSNNLMPYNDYALYPFPLSSGHSQNESREPLSMQNDSSWSYYPPNHQFSELAQQSSQTNNIQPQQQQQQQNYSTDSPIISQYQNQPNQQQQQQQQQQSSNLHASTTSTIKSPPSIPISTTTTTVNESNTHRITISSTRRTAESEEVNNITDKPQRIKRKISWSSEQLSYAFNLIKQGKTAREAARIAEIPHSTLHDRIRNPHKHPRPGKPTVLSQSEEILIVNYLVNLMDSGYNVNNNTLKNIVHEIIRNDGRAHPFKEDGPHRHWFGGFEKRHPILLEYKKKHKYNSNNNNNNKNMIKSEVTMDMIDILVKDINHYNINGNIDQIAQDIENSMNRDENEEDDENEEINVINNNNNNNNAIQQFPPPLPPLISTSSNIILQESSTNNIDISNSSIDNNNNFLSQSLSTQSSPSSPPPSSSPPPPSSLIQTNKQSTTKCKKEWNVNDIELAIKQMQNGISIRVVSNETGIPTGTIRNHIRNPNMCCKRGPPTVLHDYEEKLIEKYLIKYCNNNNIVIYKWNNDDVCKIVKRLLKNDSRENVFKNDGPHRHWYQGFLKRHPCLENYKNKNNNQTMIPSEVLEQIITQILEEKELLMKGDNNNNNEYDELNIYGSIP